MSIFWRQFPALFVGCHLLLAAALALYPHPSYALAFALLWVPLIRHKEWKKLGASTLLTLLFFFHVWHHYALPPQSFTRATGTAYFEIDSVKIAQSPFNRSYLYQGTLRSFETADGIKWRNIPCCVHLPVNAERPLANCDYLIEGELVQKVGRTFVLKPRKNLPWQTVNQTFSLAEWRLAAKNKVRHFLQKEIPHPRAAAFFVALSIGDLDERLLSLEFAKIGLQHILGISGFHFALLAAFLGCFLRLFLPPKTTYILLLILLSSYFFFVGSAPAVVRGWVAIAIFLIARLFHLNTSALNALGAGLCVEIFCAPISIANMGFQLSFLCTWAILLLYAPLRQAMHWLLPKRQLQIIAQMRPLDQHGYLFSALIREAVALNLAVHLASLPLILYLFHKFPLQSLIYNLFFPFCFSLSMLLLLISILFSCIFPPLGTLLHHCNSSFTSTLLEVTAHPLPLFDFSLRVHHFSFPLLIIILTLMFFAAIRLKKTTK